MESFVKTIIMKTIKKQIRGLALIFGLLILFQSCVAYKKTNSSIDEIVELENRVKIVTIDNRNHWYKKIKKIDNNYYGVKDFDDRSKDILLFTDDIQSIRVYDGVVSTILTVVGLSSAIAIVGGTTVYGILSSKE